MIASPGPAAVRPWLLGALVVVTAWLTAASIGAESIVPGGPSGMAAVVAWVLIGLGVHVVSRKRSGSRWRIASNRWLAAPFLAAATMLAISLLLAPAMPIAARIGLTLGTGLVPASFLPLAGRMMRRSRVIALGASVAHLGAALALIGVSSATGLRSESRMVASPGERIEIGPWLIEYTGIAPVAGPDFTAVEAELRATRGSGVSVVRPQVQTAIDTSVERRVPAVVTAWNGRLSIGLGQDRGGGREISTAWTPFVTLLWLGGAMMVLGGSLALAGLRGARSALIALVLATAGVTYERFGRADGGQAVPRAATPETWPSLVEDRSAFLGQFHRSSHWLIISDSYATRGETRDAVGILQAATRQHPRDYALWLGLGNALTDHGRGLNPAARLAFARSAELAPTSPAPGYFQGLAKLRSGNRDGALADWRAVLADAPADASWRPLVEDRIAANEKAVRRR